MFTECVGCTDGIAISTRVEDRSNDWFVLSKNWDDY